MRHAAELLRFAALAALMVPALQPPALAQQPEDSRVQVPSAVLLAQSNDPASRKAEADRLLQQGLNQIQKSQFRQAIQSWEKAVAIYRESGIRAAFPQESLQGEANVLGNLGNAYESLNNYHQAIDYHKQSLSLLRQIGNDNREEANVLMNLGIAYQSLSDYRQAINYYEQAIILFHQAENLNGKASVLMNLGIAYQSLSDYRQAISYYEQALPLFRQIENHNGKASILLNLGNAHNLLSDARQAISYYEQALILFRQIENRNGEASALMSLGIAYESLSDYRQAISYYAQALPLFQQIENRNGEASAMANLGNAYISLSDARQSIDYYKQALHLFRQIRNRQGEATALMNVGVAYQALSNYRDAIAYHQEALNLFQSIEDRNGEANALMNLGIAYSSLSNYQQSISYYKQVLLLFRNIEDRNGEANALMNLGIDYQDLGDYQQSITYYKSALSLFRQIGDLRGEADVIGTLGTVYRTLSDYRQAIDHYTQSLSLSRQIEDRQGEANALMNLGLAYQSLSDYQQSITYYKQALPLFLQIEDRQGEARTLANLGLVYRSLKNYRQAIAYYEQSLSLLRQIEDRVGEGKLLTSLGRLFTQQDQAELAIIFYKASVNVRESIRVDLKPLPQTLQQTYTESVADSYRALADLLLEQGRIPEAQQVLDLLKLEELREFTRNTRATWTGADLAYSDAEQAVIEDHTSLIAFSSKILDCQATNCKELDGLYDQLDALKEDYDDQVTKFVATVRANRAEDDIFQNPDNLSGEAEDLLRAYNANGQKSVLIYPFVLDDKLWLVWATAGRVIGSVEVSVSQKQLAQTVQRLGEQLQSPLSRLADLQATSQQLYDWIVKPLEQELQANDIQHLVFVNDRVTRYIPMAVLYDGQQYLLERYTLSTVLAPGLTDTDDRLASVDRSQVLGLGLTQAKAGFNPLPGVKEELDGIVRSGDADPKGIYPGQVHLDDAFNLETLKTRVLTHRVLHVATHAAFVPGRAEESFVLLGDGSKLKPAEIEAMEHRLSNLHLVVLSACQTALGGAAGDGTEIAGISSYFLEKGRAETVIASLWLVNDASTSLMMQRFYRLLASGELSKAEALQQAQLSLLYGEDSQARLAAARAGARPQLRQGANAPAVKGYRHPYYWAPFILIGNGL